LARPEGSRPLQPARAPADRALELREARDPAGERLLHATEERLGVGSRVELVVVRADHGNGARDRLLVRARLAAREGAEGGARVAHRADARPRSLRAAAVLLPRRCTGAGAFPRVQRAPD